MGFESSFRTIPLETLHREAALMKTEGWRFIQTHAVKADSGVDLYYSFMKDGAIVNLKVEGVQADQSVPSVTDLFLAAFVFENEARELFGVDMRDIAIDFNGGLYAPAQAVPMTFITPEQKAAREKAKKAAAAKLAKQGSQADDAKQADAKAQTGFVMTPERQARLDAKLATMAPEKVAKVKAALETLQLGGQEAAKPSGDASASADKAPIAELPANEPKKEAPAPQSVDEELESKIKLLGDEKASRVRAAIASRKGLAPAEGPADTQSSAKALDEALEGKIKIMDPEKAAAVRAAIARHGKGRD